MGGLLELVVDVLVDDAGLSHRLVAETDDLDLDLASHSADRVIHLI